MFKHAVTRVDIAGVHRLEVSGKGSCEGDCALGVNSVLSLVYETSGAALDACFATRSQLTTSVALALSIERTGRVAKVSFANPPAELAVGNCVLGVFGRAVFPPGSDPSAKVTIVLDVDASFTGKTR